MTNESYNIICKGRKIYSNLTEEEYFNTMEDLSEQFYQTGSPNPNEIETEIIGENEWQLKNHQVVVGSKLSNLIQRKLDKVVGLIPSIRRLLVIKLVKDIEGRENK